MNLKGTNLLSEGHMVLLIFRRKASKRILQKSFNNLETHQNCMHLSAPVRQMSTNLERHPGTRVVSTCPHLSVPVRQMSANLVRHSGTIVVPTCPHLSAKCPESLERHPGTRVVSTCPHLSTKYRGQLADTETIVRHLLHFWTSMYIL